MIGTPEQHLALSKIDPEWEQLIKENGPIRTIQPDADIQELRALALEKANEAAKAHDAEGEHPYVEEDIQIPTRDGSSIVARIHRPREPAADGCPIFVMYHGGGFCLGGLYSELFLCREFTKMGGIAVNVDYRLAPEFPFPTGVNDSFDALKWTAENFKELGGSPAKGFLVGGTSAGANFSSVISHLYRDEKLSPPLTGVYLSITPAGSELLCPEKYKHVYLSRDQNGGPEVPILNDISIAWFEERVKTDRSSPLRAVWAFDTHKDLPPHFFQVCGLDPLRDEALIYEDQLKEEYGIKTQLAIYPGLPHGFWSAFPEAKFTKKFRDDAVKGVEWLLEQSKGRVSQG